jgi:hypothetical protein
LDSMKSTRRPSSSSVSFTSWCPLESIA